MKRILVSTPERVWKIDVPNEAVLVIGPQQREARSKPAPKVVRRRKNATAQETVNAGQ